MKQTLSIIIPAYNEEKRIGRTLSKLLVFNQIHNLAPEIIVVDDGSSDKTLQILEQFREYISILKIWPNQGKGNTIKEGVMEASGDLILFMDADLATPLEEILNFLNELKEEDQILIGQRNLKNRNVKRTPIRALAGRTFHFITQSLVSVGDITDTQCGFKLFRKHAAAAIFSRMQIRRWAFDIEVLYLAKKMNINVRQIPISWQDKAGSKVHLLRDAFLMLKDLFKIRIWNLFNVYNLKNIEEKGLEYELFISTKSSAKEIREF